MPRSDRLWPPLCVTLLVATMLFSLTIGAYPIRLGDVIRVIAASLGLGHAASDPTLSEIVLGIRLPRVLGAALVGMALSSSGAAYQAVFRNPLVSPGLLGVLAGASFGAALGMILDLSWLAIQALSFGMGLAAVVFGAAIAAMFGIASTITLVLGGIISGAAFGAALSVLKYVADPQDQLPSIVYWLMGTLASVHSGELPWIGVPILLSVLLLSLFGPALDAMSMGDDEARALGVPVALVRTSVIAAATLASALSVSLAGMVGWVGLLVPHLARLILGPTNSRLMPASALLGAAFLVAADDLARAATNVDIPIGIVTECLGVPAFILVLSRARRAWT